ncbi:MAG: DUF3418 domain-containing protein, partial [Candidatus Competibacteraceae bacterium]|nr:DUF3418 domain-containing protein [Candidatus Competibacteraceae bacterium]
SDFLALLNLWDHYHQQARRLSKNQLRNLCREQFLSFVRMREWHDLFTQLHALVAEMGIKLNARPVKEQPDTRPAGQDRRGEPITRITQPEGLFEPLHKALLTGLLGHLGLKQQDNSYLGARGRRFYVFPGSGLFKKQPKWIMAAELVETTRLYARVNARIDPRWVEPLAAHLIKRSYGEPHWEKRPAQVAALETVTLYGLPIVSGRRVNYGPIDPQTAREIFIRRALVEGEYQTRAPFFRHNRELIGLVEELEAKVRRRDLLADEQTLFQFYDQRLPADIYSGAGFEKWRKRAEREDPRILFMDLELLLAREADEIDGRRFPDFLNINGMELPLEYRFEPGDPYDGVTVTVPLAALNQLDPRRLEWLVPGLLEARMAALLKGLPKSWRRHFVPVPDFARALRQSLVPGDIHLHLAMAAQLERMTGVAVPEEAWRLEAVPEHLRMNMRIIDPEGQVLAEGRDPAALRHKLKGRARESFAALPTPEFERDELGDWDFGELPREVAYTRNGIRLRGFPALVVKPE